MIAKIFDQIDISTKQILKDNINKIYPNILIEEVSEANFLKNDPNNEFVKIIVLNQNITNDLNKKFINKLKSNYPSIENFLVLVPENLFETLRFNLKKVCTVLEEKETVLNSFFEQNRLYQPEIFDNEMQINIKEDPLNIDNNKEDEIVPIESNENLPMDPTANSMDSDEEELLTLPTIEEVGSQEIIEMVDEEPEIIEEQELMIEVELPSSNSKEAIEEMAILLTTENPEDNNVPLIINEPDAMTNVASPLTIDQNDFKQDNKTLTLQNEKNQTDNKLEQQLEEKIISLRNEIQIPLWKKKQVDQKTIGIWSPIHRVGVTTFTVNFALFLGSLSVPVAVLEGISQNIKLMSLLDSYNKKKTEWISYLSYLMDENDNEGNVAWTYDNVNFFPLDANSSGELWTDVRIQAYMNGLKFHDLVFVDFPTGKMNSYTLKSLEYIDELWVIINNDYMSFLEWKQYIQNEVNITGEIHTIFVDGYEFSIPEKIADKLDLNLIAKVPTLQEEIALSHSIVSKKPLIKEEGVYEKLKPSFLSIYKYLTGDPTLKIKHDKVEEIPLKENWFNRVTKKIRGSKK